MDKLKITTETAEQKSIDRLYEVLKLGRPGAIPVIIDGEVKTGVIVIKEDLTRVEIFHLTELLEADNASNAIIFPFHIREAIGKLFDPNTDITLWRNENEIAWSGPAKDLPKEFRECHITQFMTSVDSSLHMMTDLE